MRRIRWTGWWLFCGMLWLLLLQPLAPLAAADSDGSPEAFGTEDKFDVNTPPDGVIDRGSGEGSGSAADADAGAGAGAEATPDAPETPAAGGSHTVSSGDTLWDIASRYYGDGSRWVEIFNANAGAIANPNLIFPGQVFTIPGATTPATDAAPADPADGGAPGGGPTTVNGRTVLDVPRFCQGNTRCPYPWSACGPTSLGMIVAFYKGGDAGNYASQLWNLCGTTGDAGTSHAGMVQGAKALGFPDAHFKYGCDLNWLQEQVKAGNPVVVNVTNHYMVVKGFDAAGNVIINDPAIWNVEKTLTYAQLCAIWNGGGCNKSAMVLK